MAIATMQAFRDIFRQGDASSNFSLCRRFLSEHTKRNVAIRESLNAILNSSSDSKPGKNEDSEDRQYFLIYLLSFSYQPTIY